ncbi:hypothetical protein [Kitasatospora sp. NPDC094015]|uniref:hypothetical protein n=1 Tax=Kitasatospora sp. NPDC094015 TaxID=3155205 RepID=UPI0033210CF2
MADNETTATAPAVAETSPSEHILPAVDAQPILDVLEGLDEEPAGEPAVVPAVDKKGPGEVFEPLGSITNHP